MCADSETPRSSPNQNHNSNTAIDGQHPGFLHSVWNRMSEYFEMRTLHEGEFANLDDSMRSFDGGGGYVKSKGDPNANGSVPGLHDEHHHGEAGGSGSSGSGGAAGDGIMGWFGGWRKPQPGSGSKSNNRLIPRNNSSYSSVQSDDSAYIEPFPFEDFDSDSDSDIYEDFVFENGVEEVGLGEGHDFRPAQLMNMVTWCDKCGELIWGFYKQCLRCSYCKYTCHYKCHSDVRLDCTESPIYQELPSTPKEQTITAAETTVIEETDTWSGLSREELRRRIDEFNETSDKDVFTLGSDTCIFVGHIKVHLNLSRPISVPTGSQLPKLCSTLKRYDHSIDTNKKRKRTSFFLPKDTLKELNIASETTTSQLVLALLERLEIIDNPRKFALFELTETGDEVLVRKVTEEERPLILCLSWGADNITKRFELRENESGMIQWEAFSIPELQNFLRMLDREEQEHIEMVKEKYARYEAQLKEAMEYIQDHHQREVEEEAKVLESLEKKRRESEGTPVDFIKEMNRRESEENILVMDESHFDVSVSHA